ncbi:hypothetical protein Mapa_009299 [Marchantia paleacea]|nr:hypothetical protein Mapa_009299 [Marchantia paleacea]
MSERLQLGSNFLAHQIRALQVVVVHEAGETLLDELVVWGMADDIIDVCERQRSAFLLRILATETTVAEVEGLQVASRGELPIHDRVFAGQHGFVKIISVRHLTRSVAAFHHEWGIRPNQHCDGSGAPGGSGRALGVNRNIGGDDEPQSPIPAGALDPIDAVEQSCGSTVARIRGIHALDITISALLEKLHQIGLDGLTLIDDGFTADLEAPNGIRRHSILLHQRLDDGQAHGNHIFAICAKPQLVLP